MKKILVIALSLILMLTVTIPASAQSKTVVNTPDEFIEAVNSKDATEIVLNSNLSFPNEQIILNLSNKTVNLNGHTIFSYHFKLIFDGENFTIKNGTMGSLNNSDYPLFIGENPSNNILIDTVTVDGGINVYNTEKVILRNCKAKARTHYAIWADQGANIIVESGNYTASNTTKYSLLGLASEYASMTINGGNFVSGNAPELVLPSGLKPVFNSGTFDKNPVNFVADDKSAAAIDSLYYVGTSDNLKNRIANAEHSVEFLKGIDEASVPEGVEVSNSTGHEIIVNGDKVPNNDTIVSNAVPTAEINYSNDGNWTNQDVTVTIVTSEPVEDILGWNKVETSTYKRAASKTTFTKTFSKNGTEIVTLTDLTGKSSQITIDIKNIDKEGPEIRGIENVSLVQGDKFDPLENVTAYDNACGPIDKIDVKLLTRQSFDTSKVGIYTFEYTATDMANNTTTATRTVTVTPKLMAINNPPKIFAKNINLHVGAKFNPLKNVTAIDIEDGDITEDIKVVKNNVNTAKVGSYQVTYSVTDSQGATSTKTIHVTVGKNTPSTGDDSNLYTYATLLAISGLAAISLFAIKKKKSN